MDLSQKLTNSSAGSATLELLVALGVGLLVISATVLVSFGNQSIALDTDTASEALYFAQEGLEEMRAEAREDLFSLVPSIVTNGIYTRDIQIADADTDGLSKLITSTVTWSTDTRPQNVTLHTVISDWSLALGSDTCTEELVGDWTNPQLLGYVDIVSNQGASDVDVIGKKAYIVTNPAASGQKDLHIIDVADPTLTPLPILGSVNTGPGLSGVHVVGKYAYVSNNDVDGQLQVIEVSDSSVPILKKTYKLPSVISGGVGNSIFYSRKVVYLGTTKADGTEFHIINVDDPLSPYEVASYEINMTINSITVRDGVAYVATQPDVASGEVDGLLMLDVSDPGSGITLLDSFTAPDPVANFGRSMYLTRSGDKLYFGRGEDDPNVSANHELYVFNATNPSNISSSSLGSVDIGDSVTALVVREHLAFLLTNTPNLGFQIWDITDPTAMFLYSSLNIQQSSTGGMDCEGNVVYVGQRSNRALQIIGAGP